MARTLAGQLFDWLEARVPLKAAIEFAQHKQVPHYAGSVWYYFGGVSLFLFIIQVVTGILLMMYYQPGIQTGYESVRMIVVHVKFGWLVRSIHTWSANLFILAIFIHMFSVFFTKAFRRPRELTWLTGMVLLALAMGFGFSGYLLPWNTLAYFATKVGTAIVAVTPVVGRPILEIRTDRPIEAMRVLDTAPGVEKTSLFGTAVHAVLEDAGTTATSVAAMLRAKGFTVSNIDRVAPSLEDVFLDVVERAGAAA